MILALLALFWLLVFLSFSAIIGMNLDRNGDKK